MRCSTVIPSSRRNSLKRDSVADLLRLAARDVGLGFPVTGILNKPKPARLISSIRESFPKHAPTGREVVPTVTNAYRRAIHCAERTPHADA